MAIIKIPSKGQTLQDENKIKAFLEEKGVLYEKWEADKEFSNSATQEEILAAYDKTLSPFMTKGNYTVADVINVTPEVENLSAIRKKFLAEHTHSEDEVRFFVDGEGLFWFNIEGQEIFSVLCQKGDLISVAANTKHWFDLGTKAFVKAIRIFIDPTGWVPHYTESKVDEKFNPAYV